MKSIHYFGFMAPVGVVGLMLMFFFRFKSQAVIDSIGYLTMITIVSLFIAAMVKFRKEHNDEITNITIGKTSR